MLPKDSDFTSLLTGGRSWTSTHGFVGMATVAETGIIDGTFRPWPDTDPKSFVPLKV